MFKKKNKNEPYVKYRSNVIQYDCMENPLRLIINRDGKQQWLDSYEEDGDVVLEWRLL